MAVSIYPVVCVHSCHLLRAQHHCLWPNGRKGPPSACPPTPTTHPPIHLPLISAIHDITVVVKNYLKIQQGIMHSRVSYRTLAIILLYLFGKSCVTILQHRRTTAASVLQNGISCNTKCDIMVDFLKSSHIRMCIYIPSYYLVTYYIYIFLVHRKSYICTSINC